MAPTPVPAPAPVAAPAAELDAEGEAVKGAFESLATNLEAALGPAQMVAEARAMPRNREGMQSLYGRFMSLPPDARREVVAAAQAVAQYNYAGAVTHVSNLVRGHMDGNQKWLAALKAMLASARKLQGGQ
jgi:hypothetical protein